MKKILETKLTDPNALFRRLDHTSVKFEEFSEEFSEEECNDPRRITLVKYIDEYMPIWLIYHIIELTS